MLASLVALAAFFGVLLLALALILQPAIALFDSLPAMADQVARRFGELRDEFAWVAAANERLADLMGRSTSREVVLASPSVIGISAGALVGAQLALLLGNLGEWAIALGACAGAGLSLALLLTLARGLGSNAVLLIGVMLATAFGRLAPTDFLDDQGSPLSVAWPVLLDRCRG